MALYDIAVETIAGEPTTLGQYRGKVLVVVNVASRCGLTKQYEALQSLYERYRDSGLVVLAFPANDFAGQEPGSNEEIASFCTSRFGVDFPVFSKISVTGAETHPLFRELIAEQPKAAGESREGFRKNLDEFLASVGSGRTNQEPGILWNFEKFLVGRDGRVVARFSPEIAPEDPIVLEAVERALRESQA